MVLMTLRSSGAPRLTASRPTLTSPLTRPVQEGAIEPVGATPGRCPSAPPASGQGQSRPPLGRASLTYYDNHTPTWRSPFQTRRSADRARCRTTRPTWPAPDDLPLLPVHGMSAEHGARQHPLIAADGAVGRAGQFHVVADARLVAGRWVHKTSRQRILRVPMTLSVISPGSDAVGRSDEVDDLRHLFPKVAVIKVPLIRGFATEPGDSDLVHSLVLIVLKWLIPLPAGVSENTFGVHLFERLREDLKGYVVLDSPAVGDPGVPWECWVLELGAHPGFGGVDVAVRAGLIAVDKDG